MTTASDTTTVADDATPANDLIDIFTQTWADLTGAGAPFEWKVQEIASVPTRVFTAAPPNLRWLWETSAAHDTAEYLVYKDERYSYTDAHQRVRALAHWLRNTHDVGRGNRVAIYMRNYPEWVLSYWAITCLGAAVVGLNAWWTAAELAFALNDCAPKVLIVDGERLERVQVAFNEVADQPTVLTTRSNNTASWQVPGQTDNRKVHSGQSDNSASEQIQNKQPNNRQIQNEHSDNSASAQAQNEQPNNRQIQNEQTNNEQILNEQTNNGQITGQGQMLRWDQIVNRHTAKNAPASLPPADIDSDDDACIFYTSGTTGTPKGAQITHRGAIHNLMHLGFVTACGDVARARRELHTAADATTPRGYVALLPVPLFHVTGCNCVLHPVTATGGRIVLMHHWDAAEALRLIESEQITVFTGVPTMSREMLQHPDWATTDTSSLAAMGGGGAAVQPDLVKKIDRHLQHGRPSTGYGLTETAGIATAINNEYYVAKADSVGPVMPCMEAKIVDPESRAELPLGQIGELALRGPNVIKGYLNQPEATAEAIVDGWFHTGDIASLDANGWVYIADRLKDVVIRGGENIHCGEVEAVIYELDEVAEAAVFGVPDERLGETVAAALVLVPGARLNREQISAHLDQRIARFKHPSQVWFLDEPLPRNANCKFLKRELRLQLTQTH